MPSRCTFTNHQKIPFDLHCPIVSYGHRSQMCVWMSHLVDGIYIKILLVSALNITFASPSPCAHMHTIWNYSARMGFSSVSLSLFFFHFFSIAAWHNSILLLSHYNFSQMIVFKFASPSIWEKLLMFFHLKITLGIVYCAHTVKCIKNTRLI